MRTLARVLDQAGQLKTSVASSLAAATRIANKLNADLQKLKDNRDLDADVRARKEKALRVAAQTAIGTAKRALDSDADIAAALKPRLADKGYWLSIAEGGAQRITEFQAMPPNTLQTAAAAALADNDPVSVWAAIMAGAKGVDLSAVDLPARVVALRIIGEIAAAAQAVTNLYTDAGSTPTGLALPTRKLMQARAVKAMA